jgi:hypothetical protein
MAADETKRAVKQLTDPEALRALADQLPRAGAENY